MWARTNHVKFGKEEKKKLAGSLAKKKLPAEECPRRNGDQKINSPPHIESGFLHCAVDLKNALTA